MILQNVSEKGNKNKGHKSNFFTFLKVKEHYMCKEDKSISPIHKNQSRPYNIRFII